MSRSIGTSPARSTGLPFSKYSGTGNDFVLVEAPSFPADLDRVHWSTVARRLCLRHDGVGADGLILLAPRRSGFAMTVLNADGGYSSMCGNAARCAAWHYLHSHDRQRTAFDYLQISDSGIARMACAATSHLTEVSVSFSKRHELAGPIEIGGRPWYYAETGTDHAVCFLRSRNELEDIDVMTVGRRLRRDRRLCLRGSNVNFVYAASPGELYLRTYERGVEAETLACATGSVAALVTQMRLDGRTQHAATVHQRSGARLSISCELVRETISIIQRGAVTPIFRGEI